MSARDKLSSGEKMRLILEYEMLERDASGKIRYGCLGQLARKWGVDLKYVRRVLKEVQER